MNKKKLSVVMAGAMLASSVAPVLAATVEKEDVSANNLGLLIKEIREVLDSKTFAKESVNGNEQGKSVYFLKVNGVAKNDSDVDTQAKLQTLLGGLTAGDTVEIWSKGYEEKDGKYYANGEVVPTYKNVQALNTLKTTLESDTDFTANVIDTVAFNDKDELVITFKSAVGLKDVTLKVGSNELDLTKYKHVNGTVENINKGTAINAADFDGFVNASKTTGDLAEEKIKEITIVAGGNNFNVEDLYDGLMLTTEGHDLLNDIKYYGKAGATVTVNPAEYNKNTKTYGFTVEFDAEGVLPAKTVVIKGTDKANTERLQNWLDEELAKVDILAGDNRYETAVKIAKEQALIGKFTQSTSNIVLVNGEALVDGLAAAPLAAHLKTNTDAVPVLLTKADTLPKETKAYLKELLAQKTVGDLDTTIHLVGGTSVLNKSLEKELKALGFEVERYGGDNREETSLKVAEVIGADEAFVVGANGEADAMSIAPVAAKQKTPIIVAKNGGISEDAIEELKDIDVAVIGGESAVSKADFEAIKEEAKTVTRISGSNRQATNAEIINKYYTGGFGNNTAGNAAQNVIVAKDGQNNKMELIDALAAANMASEKKAPIVLATNKLSTAQINALELNAKNAATLYQVGHGVSRDVVKTIAQRLGLAN